MSQVTSNSLEAQHPRDTFDKYCEVKDGRVQVKPEYPERQALHDRMIKDVLSQVPTGNDKPMAVLLVGAPGAGKSTALKQLGPDMQRQYAHIDADHFKINLPEFKVLSQMTSSAAMIVHEEGSYLAKVAVQEAVHNRQNFIYDGTGVNTAKYSKLIDDLQAQGYEVGLMMVHTSVDIGLERVAVRAQATGRDVPKDFVVECYEKAPKSFVALKDKVDKFQVLDSSGPEVRTVWLKNGAEEILDPQFIKQEFQYESTRDQSQSRVNTARAVRDEAQPRRNSTHAASSRKPSVRDAVQR